MKENTRRLIDYSLPAVFENILQTSVGFVDSVLIAKISLVAVSAVSLGTVSWPFTKLSSSP